MNASAGFSAADTERFEIRLGEALNKAGVLTGSQLAQAMYEKRDSPFMLGEICLEYGWLTVDKLYPFIPSNLLRLGEILVLYGVVKLDQLKAGLIRQQQKPGTTIGQALLQQGLITNEQLTWALEEQRILRKRPFPNAWQALEGRLPGTQPQGSRAAEELKALHDQVSQYQAQLATLAQQRQEWELFRQQTQRQQTEQQARHHEQLATQQATLEAKEAQLQATAQALDAARQQIKEITQQLQQSQAQATSHEQHQQQLAQAQAVTRQQIEHYQQQIQQQEQVMAKLQPVIQQLRGQVGQLNQKLAEAQAGEQESQTKLQEQQSQLMLAQSTKERLIRDVAEARRQIAELTRRCQIQQQEETDYLQQIAGLKSDLLQERSQKAAFVQEVQQLREQLSAQSHQLKTVQQELIRLRTASVSSRTTSGPVPLPARQSMPPTPIAPEVKLTAAVNQEEEWSDDSEITLVDLAEEESEALQAATPWVQRVLTALRSAGLISNAEIELVLSEWQRDGGTFTEVLSAHTGLQTETVKFFSDGGYSVKLSGANQMGDFLRASGLVAPQLIDQAQASLQPGQSLCQLLAHQGLIRQETADYFTRNFGQRHNRFRSLRDPSH
ncbi:MAG: hypothetical protein NW237_08530 [Cyanobacteriota bacterium]|nr:hypothetical protein [Cyanobacteriota bacterium]